MAVTRNNHYLDNKGLETLWAKIKAGFQAQEAGKGLSTNDYTDADKTKLAGIATGAEVNVQSDWSQTNSSEDDFIKNKPDIYTKTEIDNLLAAGVKYQIVASLPATGVAGTIYLVPSATSTTGDNYDEYIYVPAEGQVAAHFEKIGTTQADLSNVVKVPTAGTAVGDATHPAYVNSSGTATAGSQYAGGTKVTLNGTDSGADAISIYAATSVGTAGQYLKSSGSGAPVWETFDSSPTSASTNGITSGAVYTALDGKVNTADFITDTEIDTICV